MLRFSEEIMLLTLNDGGGKFIDVPSISLEYALAGAVLMDLAMEGRIDTDPERLFVINSLPLGDDLLDPTLERIVQSAEVLAPIDWITKTASHANDIRERSLARLVERGILEREDDRFLWVFRARRYPVIDNKTFREVKLRIMSVLFSDDIPETRDIVLISLADTCGIFRGIFSSKELENATKRIDQVGKMELVGREVSKAVLDIKLSLAETPLDLGILPIHGNIRRN